MAALHAALDRFDPDRMDRWGRRLAAVHSRGGRLLAAGNGGSAAHAQHLTAELVGRYRDERPALAALALHADTSSLTAIAYDYGYDPADPRPVLGGSADPVRRGRHRGLRECSAPRAQQPRTW